MKKLVPWLLLLLLAVGGAAKDGRAVLEKADRLLAEKKYASAFKVLDKADTKNENPEIFLRKSYLARDFYVLSDKFQVFSFKDLEKDQDIEAFRGREGTYEKYVLEPDKVLARLIKRYPKNWKLRKELGIFYDRVLATYGKDWIKSEDEVIRLAEENLETARRNGEADHESLLTQGRLKLLAGKAAEAIPFFQESLSLQADFAPAHYNLAYALWKTGDAGEALMHAQQTLQSARESRLQGDAGRLAGAICLEAGQAGMALRFFQAADRADPRNFDTLRYLLPLYIQRQEMESADRIAEEILALSPGNPNLMGGISGIYWDSGRKQELRAFIERMMARYQDRDEAMGNLLFHRARFLLADGDKPEARKSALEAKDRLRKVFPGDHQVFPLLEKMLQDAEEPQGAGKGSAGAMSGGAGSAKAGEAGSGSAPDSTAGPPP